MTFLIRLMLATAGLTVALTLAWAVAFMSWAHGQSERQPPTIRRPLPATIDHQPPTIDASFVASTLDRTSKRYHLPDCSYVRLLKHGRGFASEAEAHAAGYEPCQRCLVPQIARSK